MGQVDAFSLPGFDVVFYSNDHLPPHFHVREAGEWEIRVDIRETTENVLAYEIKWPNDFSGPKSSTRKELRNAVVEHRAALLEEWEEKVSYE